MKIVGKKLKMTQVYKENRVIGVTPILVSDISVMEELKDGDAVKVSGVSKGKGFQGVVKRHGFHGGPKTHGQKNRHRAPGSIGNTALQRVAPGKKMAGRMGGVRVSIKNVKVIELREKENLILIGGAIPGIVNSFVEIQI